MPLFPRLVVLLCLLISFANGAPPPWPHEQSDLKPDPRITFGRLENGFRYMIMPHAKPAGRVTLYLLVEAGSFHEEDHQRGLAHFVEHMAFNGSRDFPGDETIKTLQRFGLDFGADINASTEMMQTCFHLQDLSVADPTALPTGLKVLRNFADGAFFEKAAVNKERAVILAEERSRQSQARLTWRRELEFLPPFGEQYTLQEISGLFAHTRIEKRIDPMGEKKIIATATSENLRAFYDRWYRPERMVLAVVGDIDPRSAAALIENTFASLRARAPQPAEPETGQLPQYAQESPHIFVTPLPWATQTHLTLGAVLPREGVDNSARRAAELPAHFVLRRLSTRLEKSALFPASFDSLFSHSIPGRTLSLLRTDTPKKHLKEAAIALVTEVRRAQQQGFTAEELAQQIHAFRANLESTSREALNRTSPEIACALAFAAVRGVVLTDPEEARRLTEAALSGVTPASCLEAARQLWPAHQNILAIWGDVKPSDLNENLLSTIPAAWNADHAALEEKIITSFPYTDFGPPGKIIAQRHDETLDCWFLQFANGVRFNFKRTPFEAGQVQVRVNFGDGGLSADRRGFGMAVGAVFFGGFHDLPFENIGDVMQESGARMDFNLRFDEDNYGLGETLEAKNLPLGLNILTAFFTAPAFRETAELKMRAMFEPQLAAGEQTASSVADRQLRRFILGQHRSPCLPTVAETRALPFAALRDFIAPQLLQSPMEITLVGDISLEEATAQVSRTFGALPPRSANDNLAALRVFTPPTLPHVETVRFDGNTNAAAVVLSWPAPDAMGTLDDCHASLLTTILKDRFRLKIRQEMGATYSPTVDVWTLSAYTPSTLILRCLIEAQPREADRVSKAMHEVVDALLRDGVAPDELERARQPLILESENSLKTNSGWFNQLLSAQTKPQYIHGIADRPSLYRAITAADLNTFARQLLNPSNCCEIRAVPQ